MAFAPHQGELKFTEAEAAAIQHAEETLGYGSERVVAAHRAGRGHPVAHFLGTVVALYIAFVLLVGTARRVPATQEPQAQVSATEAARLPVREQPPSQIQNAILSQEDALDNKQILETLSKLPLAPPPTTFVEIEKDVAATIQLPPSSRDLTPNFEFATIEDLIDSSEREVAPQAFKRQHPRKIRAQTQIDILEQPHFDAPVVAHIRRHAKYYAVETYAACDSTGNSWKLVWIRRDESTVGVVCTPQFGDGDLNSGSAAEGGITATLRNFGVGLAKIFGGIL